MELVTTPDLTNGDSTEGLGAEIKRWSASILPEARVFDTQQLVNWTVPS